MEVNPQLQQYYEYLKAAKADVAPTYESFEKTLADENSARQYHKYLRDAKFDAPESYESFSNTLGLKKKVASEYVYPTAKVFSEMFSSVSEDSAKPAVEETPQPETISTPKPEAESFLPKEHGVPDLSLKTPEAQGYQEPPITQVIGQTLSQDRIDMHAEEYKKEAQTRISDIDKEIASLPEDNASMMPQMNFSGGLILPTRPVSEEKARLLKEKNDLRMAIETPSKLSYVLGKAYNQSMIGLADKIINGGESKAPEEWLNKYDSNTLTDVTATALGFMLDMPFFSVMGKVGATVGKMAAKPFVDRAMIKTAERMIKAGIPEKAAKELALKAAKRTSQIISGVASSAAGLGAYGFVVSVLSDWSQPGASFDDIKWGNAFKRGGKDTLLGASVGGLGIATAAVASKASAIPSLAGRIGAKVGVPVAGLTAESALFTYGGALLEGRAPKDVTGKEFMETVALLGMLKVSKIPKETFNMALEPKKAAIKIYQSLKYDPQKPGQGQYEVNIEPWEIEAIGGKDYNTVMDILAKDDAVLGNVMKSDKVPALLKQRLLWGSRGVAIEDINFFADNVTTDGNFVEIYNKNGVLLDTRKFASLQEAFQASIKLGLQIEDNKMQLRSAEPDVDKVKIIAELKSKGIDEGVLLSALDKPVSERTPEESRMVGDYYKLIPKPEKKAEETPVVEEEVPPMQQEIPQETPEQKSTRLDKEYADARFKPVYEEPKKPEPVVEETKPKPEQELFTEDALLTRENVNKNNPTLTEEQIDADLYRRRLTVFVGDNQSSLAALKKMWEDAGGAIIDWTKVTPTAKAFADLTGFDFVQEGKKSKAKSEAPQEDITKKKAVDESLSALEDAVKPEPIVQETQKVEPTQKFQKEMDKNGVMDALISYNNLTPYQQKKQAMSLNTIKVNAQKLGFVVKQTLKGFKLMTPEGKKVYKTPDKRSAEQVQSQKLLTELEPEFQKYVNKVLDTNPDLIGTIQGLSAEQRKQAGNDIRTGKKTTASLDVLKDLERQFKAHRGLEIWEPVSETWQAMSPEELDIEVNSLRQSRPKLEDYSPYEHEKAFRDGLITKEENNELREWVATEQRQSIEAEQYRIAEENKPANGVGNGKRTEEKKTFRSEDPVKQKQIDTIDKEYNAKIADKQTELDALPAQIEKAVKKANDRNGLFGDTTPVGKDEVIKREEQGFKVSLDAVRKPFKQKQAQLTKEIADLNKERESKIGEVLKQKTLDFNEPITNEEKANTQPDTKVSTGKEDKLPAGTEPDKGGTVKESEAKPVEPTKVEEGFTPKEVINKAYTDLKAKIGEKKVQEYFRQVDRLFNPNKTTIAEYRHNGVVVKDGDKYTFHALADMSTKTWRVAGKFDVTKQFEKPASKELPPIEPVKETPPTENKSDLYKSAEKIIAESTPGRVLADLKDLINKATDIKELKTLLKLPIAMEYKSDIASEIYSRSQYIERHPEKFGQGIYSQPTESKAEELKRREEELKNTGEKKIEVTKDGVKYGDKAYTDIDTLIDDFDKFPNIQEYNKVKEKVTAFEKALHDEAVKNVNNITNRINKGITDIETQIKKDIDDKNSKLSLKLFPDIWSAAGTAQWRIFSPVRDAMANSIAKQLKRGVTNQTGIIRWSTKVLTNLYNGLLRTQVDMHGSIMKGLSGKLELSGAREYGKHKARTLLNEWRDIVHGDWDSLNRVWAVLDPKLATKPSENPLTYGDLGLAEKNLYFALKEWMTWGHEITYANGLIPTKTYLKYKDVTGDSNYIARMYDQFEMDILSDPAIRGFAERGNDSYTSKIAADIYKARKELHGVIEINGRQYDSIDSLKEARDNGEITQEQYADNKDAIKSDEWRREHAIKDPTYLVAKRIMQTIQNVGIKKYMDAVIANHPEYVLTIPKKDVIPDGYRRLGSSYSWGPFRNKVVASHIVEDLTGFYYQNAIVNTAYDAIKLLDRTHFNQFYKKFRTVFNPFVQLGNVTGNVFLASVNGINPFAFVKGTIDNRNIIKKNPALYEELLKSGYIGSNAFTGEMKSAERVTPINTQKGIKTWPKRAYNWFDERATKAYVGADNLAKISAYQIFRRQGLTHEQAIRRGYDAFQNYATVGKTWDLTSKIPLIGPTFVKFQADLTRIMVNNMLTTPLSTIGTFMVIKMLGQLASTLSGESDEEKKIRETRKGVPKVPFVDIPLVFKFGKAEINGARYLTPLMIYPQGDNEMDLATLSKFMPLQVQKKEGGNIFPKFAAADATWGFLKSIWDDSDFRTMSIQNPKGNRYTNPNITTEERVLNVLKFAARSQIPFYKGFTDIYNAATGQLDYYDRKRTWFQAILNNVIKIQQFDKPELKRYMERNLDYLTSRYASLATSMGTAQREYYKAIQLAEDNGLTGDALKKAVEREGKIRDKRLQKSLDEQIPIMEEIERLTEVYKKWNPDDPYIQENFEDIESGKSQRFNVLDLIDLQKKNPVEYNLLKKNGLLVRRSPQIPEYYQRIKVTEEEKKKYANLYWQQYLIELDRTIGLTQEEFDAQKERIAERKRSRTKTESGIEEITGLQEAATKAASKANTYAERNFRRE